MCHYRRSLQCRFSRLPLRLWQFLKWSLRIVAFSLDNVKTSELLHLLLQKQTSSTSYQAEDYSSHFWLFYPELQWSWHTWFFIPHVFPQSSRFSPMFGSPLQENICFLLNATLCWTLPPVNRWQGPEPGGPTGRSKQLSGLVVTNLGRRTSQKSAPLVSPNTIPKKWSKQKKWRTPLIVISECS